jgi:hypothetical protein
MTLEGLTSIKKSRQFSPFFSCSHRVVYKEFLLLGVTAKPKYHLEVPGRLRRWSMRVVMEIAEIWIRSHSIVSS